MMDRNKQREIWQRVYGKPTQLPALSRRVLEQCYRRELALQKDYDRRRDDPIYGAAFVRLAEETMEHCKMLRQILKK